MEVQSEFFHFIIETIIHTCSVESKLEASHSSVVYVEAGLTYSPPQVAVTELQSASVVGGTISQPDASFSAG